MENRIVKLIYGSGWPKARKKETKQGKSPSMRKKSALMNQVVFLLIISLIIHSCCTKKECVNSFDMKEIELKGFTRQELDEIFVASYTQGSDFTKLIDSTNTSVCDSNVIAL